MRWSENREQFILSFFKMGQPRHFFVYLRSFQAKFYRKIVILSGIRTRIIRVEGELSDHLTITTAQKFILCTQGSEFKLTWARAAEFSLMKERLNERSIDVKIERQSTTWRDVTTPKRRSRSFVLQEPLDDVTSKAASIWKIENLTTTQSVKYSYF